MSERQAAAEMAITELRAFLVFVEVAPELFAGGSIKSEDPVVGPDHVHHAVRHERSALQPTLHVTELKCPCD